MAHAINLLPLILSALPMALFGASIGIGIGLLWCRRALGNKDVLIAYLTGYLNRTYQMLVKARARTPKGRETE